MNADSSWILRIHRPVEYTCVDGTTRSIAPGEHLATAVHAKGVPTGEAELECWLVTERNGAGETEHDVDGETLVDWQRSGAAELGRRLAG